MLHHAYKCGIKSTLRSFLTAGNCLTSNQSGNHFQVISGLSRRWTLEKTVYSPFPYPDMKKPGETPAY
jgi:hypothetical protein